MSDYFEFIDREGTSLFRETASEIARAVANLAPRIRTASGEEAESLHDLDAASARLLARAETICRRHDRARLMLLFRQTPITFVVELLGGRRRADPLTVANVFVEAMLCGTNCILAFAPELQAAAPQPFLGMKPERAEMADAVRLALFVFAHRLNIFHANELARRRLTAGVSHDELITSYNQRQERARARRPTHREQAMIGPTLSMYFREADLRRRLRDSEGGEQTVFLRTWVPARLPVEDVQEAYGYLAGRKGFAGWAGCSYDTWLRVWIAMNAVLERALVASAEQLASYGASGLTAWSMDSLVQSIREAAATMFTDPPSIDDCRIVASNLVYQQQLDDVRFPEQPFVLYRFADGLTLWDGVRHMGLLRSIARSLSQGGGDARSQGRALEEQIAGSVAERFEVTPAVRVRIKEDRQVVGEVDVAFAWRGVLFAVEAKNEFHNVSYFLEGSKVFDRTAKLRRYLDEHDELLRRYRASLRQRVPGAEGTAGVIGVVCTREVEFIPGRTLDWWLLADRCPRLCQLDELIDALPELGAETLRDHHSFLAWS